MQLRIGPWRAALFGSVVVGTAFSLAGVGVAGTAGHHPHGAAARQRAFNAYVRAHSKNPTNNHTPNDGDLADVFAAFNNERTAPSGTVTGPALADAARQAAKLPATAGSWQEFTSKPYNAQPANYTDPFWSNAGAGFSLVGGRVTALTTTPNGTWFAGAADGGVWRSSDQGTHWTPVFDAKPTLSIGALAVDPADGSLWVGTGEANVSADSYAGTGVYRSADNGKTFQPVGVDRFGVNPLTSHTVFRIAFDAQGDAYAATDNGLFRMAAGSNTWTEVLDPAGPNDNPPYDQQVTDVAVQPGSNGKVVIAAIGWHGPGNTQNNGFYQSTDGGQTFSEVTPSGDVNASDIGRTTFAYSADGSKLYAIVQSPAAQAAGKESVLQGIFVSSGSPASVTGPWTKIADEAKLAASGSALGVGSGYGVGVQAWYNQDLAVDPANPDHVYAGLEEVFQSVNGGTTWNTASPYWNYTLPCESTSAGCPNTTHPDQHAMMITGGKLVIGNDGGVYSRALSDTAQYGGWTDLNATLRNWQYYDARAGALNSTSTGVWGGLQDNGTSFLGSGSQQMAEPAGGDGFYVVVDPANANRMVGEYTDGTMYSSTDGGHSFYDYVSPTCVAQATVGLTPRSDCDPAARFATPLIQDQQNKGVWVTGGQDIWVTSAGWHTKCTDTTCSWQPVYNLGSGNAVTALTSAHGGTIIYAAWVAGGGNPGPGFGRGIATNYGGAWHQVNMTGLPQRYIAGVTVDPAHPGHAYAIFNGYSRRFVPGGGVGHVFETRNGGKTWTNITGNLPDIPGDALVLSHHRLALGTDQGVFTAAAGQGTATTWSRLGHGLPNAVVDDLTAGPNGFIYAGTHGRGVWRFRFSG
ncbi:MAG TPA: sialidase family protein [Streptosporangiaceae bacterium]